MMSFGRGFNGTIFKAGNLAQRRIKNFDPTVAPFKKYREYAAKPAAENLLIFEIKID